MNLESLEQKHKDIDNRITQLEKTREHDRSSETKSKLMELKKYKLLLKDQIYGYRNKN